MYTNANITENHGEAIGHIGWKYYNTIKKKAMEQEFSWSGLFLSLSIAFFIVISSALILSFLYQSLEKANISRSDKSYQIHILEKSYIEGAEYYSNNKEMKENTLV